MNLKWILTLVTMMNLNACTKDREPNTAATDPSEDASLYEMSASAQVILKTPNSQPLAEVVLHEEDEGIRIQLASKKLSKNTIRLTLEETCHQEKIGHKPPIHRKLIKQVKIQDASFAEEFYLRGYTLSKDDPATLDGKALKIYRVESRSLAVEIACGKIDT